MSICYSDWWNYATDWLWRSLVMDCCGLLWIAVDCCGISTQTNPWSLCLKTRKDVSCWVISEIVIHILWQTYCIYSNDGSWYPEACSGIGLKHLLRLSYEYTVERGIEYLKHLEELNHLTITIHPSYLNCVISNMFTNGYFWLSSGIIPSLNLVLMI